MQMLGLLFVCCLELFSHYFEYELSVSATLKKTLSTKLNKSTNKIVLFPQTFIIKTVLYVAKNVFAHL